MIKSPILISSGTQYNFMVARLSTLPAEHWYFCRHALHKVFEFPKGVKRIQFQAWPEPGRDRVEIKSSDLSCNTLTVTL